jgi:hypothetical protein
MDILRELENFTKIQLELSNHMKDGFLEMARVKHSGGRKFHIGTAFLPKKLDADPNCKINVHKDSNMYSSISSINNSLLHSRSNTLNVSNNKLRNRKHNTEEEKVCTSTSAVNNSLTATNLSRDPAHIFGILSPPPLKSCSSHFKAIIELSIKLANCKQRLHTLTAEVDK